VGDVDKFYLLKLIDKVEALISRKVRYVIYNREEWSDELMCTFTPSPLLLWTAD